MFVCLVKEGAARGGERAGGVAECVGEVVLEDDRLVDLDDLFLENADPWLCCGT